MSLTINLAGIIVFTSLTGSIAQIIWYLTKRRLEKYGYLRWCYAGLWAVTLLYFIPIAFGVMKWSANYHGMWGGVLFEPTPILLRIFEIAILLWIFGVAVMGIKLFWDVRCLRSLCHNSMVCEFWKIELFEKVCGELGILPQKVRLRQSFDMVMPVFTGIRKPTVIIPAIHEFQEEQLRAIFLHELTHYKQGDAWLMLLSRGLKVTQYFNPFVWWLNSLTDKWSEFVCDSKVYVKTGGLENYYGVICSLMEAVCRISEGPFTYLGKNRNEVKERLLYMKEFDKAKKRPAAAGVVLSVALLASGSLTAAAANGVAEGYREVYGQTVVAIEETIVPVYIEEHTDDGPADGITVVEERIPDDRSYANWTVSGNNMKMTSGFYVKSGQEIAVSAIITSGDSSVNLGIVDVSGKRRYVTVNDSASYIFSASNSGTYRVFVENGSSTAVGVELMFHVK